MAAKYKVGDRVTIKVRTLGQSSYRHGFVDEMAELSGKQFTIRSVSEGVPNSNRVPDDGYDYYLEETRFTWASSMFEEPFEIVSSVLSYEGLKDSSIKAFIKRKKCPELDFNL